VNESLRFENDSAKPVSVRSLFHMVGAAWLKAHLAMYVEVGGWNNRFMLKEWSCLVGSYSISKWFNCDGTEVVQVLLHTPLKIYSFAVLAERL